MYELITLFFVVLHFKFNFIRKKKKILKIINLLNNGEQWFNHCSPMFLINLFLIKCISHCDSRADSGHREGRRNRIFGEGIIKIEDSR